MILWLCSLKFRNLLELSDLAGSKLGLNDSEADAQALLLRSGLFQALWHSGWQAPSESGLLSNAAQAVYDRFSPAERASSFYQPSGCRSRTGMPHHWHWQDGGRGRHPTSSDTVSARASPAGRRRTPPMAAK